jgi:hypothetical protein
MWFGLQPPADAPVAWGARAIVDTRGGYATLDLLPDRQQFRGDEARIPELQARLNQEALPELRRRVARFEPDLTDGRSHSIILIDGKGWRLMASQQGSYGYLYLVAFPYPPSAREGEEST